MSLQDFMIHTADIQLNDDTRTGTRGGLTDRWTTVQAAVRCRVHDLPAERALAFGREMERITHKVHFATSVKLDATHRLAWTDPDDGAVRYLLVRGTRRPKAPSMPYVVLADEQVT